MIKYNPIAKVCRPDFFILGTRRGGTTALYTLLASHPRVAALRIRGGRHDGEVFTSMENIERYNAQFIAWNPDLLVGDATAGRLTKDAEEIVKACGHKQSKFIIMLRDPVERCLSQNLARAYHIT